MDENILFYADPSPRVIMIQLVERKEKAFFSEIAQAIHTSSPDQFVLAGLPIEDWCRDLMPWNDPAVDRRPESGQYAEIILAKVHQLLDDLYQQYGKLPCILGGYSLGGLFSLWSATRSSSFQAIAAASPSVWICNWMEYVASRPILASDVYMSLGNREEHVKNRFMKQVGNNIRTYHSMLVEQLGESNTILEWNEGGHFQDFVSRIARSYIWCSKMLFK